MGPAPAGLSAPALATMSTCFVTAELAFGRAELKAGERVLIHAASGGVGLAAIQLARSIGAEVFATASTPKQPYLRSLGVDQVFDSRRTDFGDEIFRATGGEGVDVVLNSLTGEGFIEASLSCLRQGGRFVEIAKRDIWSPDEMSTSRPDVAYSVLDLDHLKRVDPQTPGSALTRVMDRLSAGELAPLPHTVWPLAEIRPAMEVMRTARHIGKNVLRMPPLGRGELRADRTYLVTGGLGGIGCEVARWLAGCGAGTIMLNGRREPDPEAVEVIRELRDDGVDVRVELADMTDPAAIDEMLARIEGTLPELGGVIHSVGVLSDGVIENQTWDRFEQVLWPKVLGAWHLHQATKAKDLDMFVLFSSVTGVVGNPGQANHAAANAFLDQLAAHRRALGLPGQAIAWGAWSGIGEAEEHRERIEQQLAYSGARWITPAEGIKALDWLVHQDVTAPTVTSVDWQVAASAWETPAPFFSEVLSTTGPPGPHQDSAAGDRLLSRLWDLPAAERQPPLVEFICQELTAVMRLASSPSPSVSFFDLGMDSLMAVELRNRLNRALAGEHTVSNTAVFDYPDATSLAAHLAKELDSPTATAPVPQRSARRQTGSPDERIAIVGMACRLPGAPDIEAYWRRLEDGADAVTDGRPDPGVWEGVLGDPDAADPALRRGAFVEGIDTFDAKFFRIAPIEARTMDPAQRMLLETSWHALEDAGIDPDGLKGSRTGVYAGVGGSEYRDLIASRGQYYSYIGTNPAVTVGRVAFALGLQGPAMPVDMACASSLVAVHQAAASLQRGEVDMALAGGVNATLSPGVSGFLRDHGMLSTGGRCRAFDAAADGFVRGEGCGVLVLKRLSDAEDDGDRIWGVVMGSAVNQNGQSAGLLAPNGPAQERVMAEALAQAGVEPGDVDYLEAHGVGSPFGDPIEMNAVATVFGPGRSSERPLLVGSVKTNIGHLEWASGAASLIKAVLAMRRRSIPATLNFSDPNPHVDWDRMPTEVVSQRVGWPSAQGRPPLAAVNSFGISGTNAHVLVAGYPDSSDEGEMLRPIGPAKQVGTVLSDLDGRAESAEFRQRTTRLLPLSGKSPAALRALAGRYLEFFDGCDGAQPDLADMAWTATAGRSHFRCRAGVVFDDAAQLRQRLEELARPDQAADEAAPSEATKAAFVYAGLDDRLLGTARELYETEPVARRILDDCDETLVGQGHGPLLDVILGSDSDDAAGPEVAAAAYALQCAVGALWKSVGVSPSVVVADGLGRIAAAQAVGALSLSQGLQAVTTAAAAPGQASPPSDAVGDAADIAYWYPEAQDWVPAPDLAAVLYRMGVNALIEFGADSQISQSVLDLWPASKTGEADLHTPVILASLQPRSEDAARVLRGGEFTAAVAQAYEAGFSVRPEGLFAGEARRRVPLPGYPFQRIRHWVDPPKTA